MTKSRVERLSAQRKLYNPSIKQLPLHNHTESYIGYQSASRGRSGKKYTENTFISPNVQNALLFKNERLEPNIPEKKISPQMKKKLQISYQN